MTNPMIPVADLNKKILISPTVMDRSVEGSSEYFFTLGHTVQSQEVAIKKFFDLNPNVKTISVLCWNDAWGKANSEIWKKVIVEQGLKIVSEDCSVDYSNDYRMEVLKIKSKNPDAIIVGVSSGVINTVFKRFSEFNIQTKILGLNTTEEALRNGVIDKSFFKNVWFINWAPSKEFTDKFKNTYGVAPLVEAQNSYEVIRSIAEALKLGGNILKAIKNVRYEGVDGYIDFKNYDNLSVNRGESRLFKISDSGEAVLVDQ